MKVVFLVETSHPYQLPAHAGTAQFRGALTVAVTLHGVKAIAEEMSVDGLKGADRSICHEVADACSIPHRYCDPTIAEREALGILVDEDGPRLSAFAADRNQAEAEAEVSASHRRREQVWLDRLFDLDTWPVLFVCGANHTEPFRTLLEANGVVVQVLFRKWAPD